MTMARDFGRLLLNANLVIMLWQLKQKVYNYSFEKSYTKFKISKIIGINILILYVNSIFGYWIYLSSTYFDDKKYMF